MPESRFFWRNFLTYPVGECEGAGPRNDGVQILLALFTKTNFTSDVFKNIRYKASFSERSEDMTISVGDPLLTKKLYYNEWKLTEKPVILDIRYSKAFWSKVDQLRPPFEDHNCSPITNINHVDRGVILRPPLLINFLVKSISLSTFPQNYTPVDAIRDLSQAAFIILATLRQGKSDKKSHARQPSALVP